MIKKFNSNHIPKITHACSKTLQDLSRFSQFEWCRIFLVILCAPMRLINYNYNWGRGISLKIPAKKLMQCLKHENFYTINIITPGCTRWKATKRPDTTEVFPPSNFFNNVWFRRKAFSMEKKYSLLYFFANLLIFPISKFFRQVEIEVLSRSITSLPFCTRSTPNLLLFSFLKSSSFYEKKMGLKNPNCVRLKKTLLFQSYSATILL